MITIDIDLSELERAIGALNQLGSQANSMIQSAGHAVAQEYISELSEATPSDSGSMKSMWKVQQQGMNVAIINDAPYADFVDQGTGIYGPYKTPIRPRSKRYMKFEYKGTTVYARSVKGQPGKYLSDMVDGEDFSRRLGYALVGEMEAVLGQAIGRGGTPVRQDALPSGRIVLRDPRGRFAAPL